MADQAKPLPQKQPASVTRADRPVLQTSTSSAAARPYALPPTPKQWCWEHPGWAGRPGRFTTSEEIQLPALTDCTMVEYTLSHPLMAAQRALRQKQRDEADKKRLDEFWTGLAIETPLPPPQPTTKRGYLNAPPAYSKAYEKFRSVFGGVDDRNDQSCYHASMAGHLQASVQDILPRPAEIDLTAWTRPNAVHPPAPAPLNGSHNTKPLQNFPVAPNNTTTDFIPSENRPQAPLPPAPQPSLPPLNGAPPVRSPFGDLPPRPPQSDPPTAPPPPAPVRSAPTDHLPSKTNPLLHITDNDALRDIDRTMDRIYDTIKKVGNSVKKSGDKTAWRVNTNTQKARDKLSGYVKSLNDICDWAQRPDGRVDETKLPRSTWKLYGLGANDLGSLNEIFQKGYEWQPDALNEFWKAANRAENLFK